MSQGDRPLHFCGDRDGFHEINDFGLINIDTAFCSSPDERVHLILHIVLAHLLDKENIE